MRTTERGCLLYMEERRMLTKNLVAVDRLMSPEQRNHFVGKLDSWKKNLMDSLKEVKRLAGYFVITAGSSTIRGEELNCSFGRVAAPC